MDVLPGFVEVEGDLRTEGDKKFLKVNSLKILRDGRVKPVPQSDEASLALKDLAGVDQSLAGMKGRIVVLNFWATGCPPCVEEMPSLVELQKKMGDKLTILAVSLDEDEDAYKKFVETRAQGLTTVRDSKQISNALYGTYRFPESFVIDKDGKIQRKFIGAVDWTSPEIVEYFEKL